MNRSQVKSVYATFIVVSVASVLWLIYSLVFPQQQLISCPFQAITGIGCPSCGITRSVLSIAGFDLPAAWNFNPLGFPVFVMVLLTPALLIYDFVFQRRIFYVLYERMEQFLKNHRLVSASLVVVVVVNWIVLVLREGNL
jgi:hypothetical protein